MSQPLNITQFITSGISKVTGATGATGVTGVTGATGTTGYRPMTTELIKSNIGRILVYFINNYYIISNITFCSFLYYTYI